MARRLTKEIKAQIRSMYNEGIPTGVIAQMLDLPEFAVVNVLFPLN